MVTGLDINKEELPELMAREDFWKILPNIWTMRIRPDPKDELRALLRVERSGDQRRLIVSPGQTIPQIMRIADKGIFGSRDLVTASWAVMVKPPNNEREAELLESFFKEPRDIHTIQTTSQYRGARYTVRELEEYLDRLYHAGSAQNVKSLSLGLDVEIDPNATYAASAAKLTAQFPFSSDKVHSLIYRAYRAHTADGDSVCPTAGDCFTSPDLATACEGLNSLTLDVRGILPPEPQIPKSLKELTLCYRVPDLPDASSVEAMACRLDKMDPEGSLKMKIESDWDLVVRGTKAASVASKKLEDHRLARKELYERKLQEMMRLEGSGAGNVDEL